MNIRIRQRFLPHLALLTLSLGLAATPALADAIDGEWCRDGRSFKIDGPSITTYGGSSIRGDYNRHGFHYVAPQGEPEAGVEIIMVLRGEELLDLFRKGKDGAQSGPESWRRCRVTS